MDAWKRNLAVIWMAELLAISGLSLIMPFMPYYVQELGVTDPAQVALWAGTLVSVHALTMAISAPIWGTLADRYGRKLMVERAIFGGALTLALMSLVQNVYQLTALRLFQGLLTGTVVAANTLVASNVPRERVGYALGILQMAIYLGASLGPTLGGVLADTLGYRSTFWVMAGLLFVSGLSVHLWVREKFYPQAQAKEARVGDAWKNMFRILREPAIVPIILVRILSRTGIRTLSPVLPLFVQALLPDGAKVASAAGVVVGAQAAAGAAGSVVFGRVGDRVGHRRVLVTCTFLAAVLYVPQFFAQNVGQLLVFQMVVGLATGGLLTSVSALLAQLSPEGRQGLVYGLDSSAVSMANFVGPLFGAGVAAWLGVRWVFLWTAGLLGVSALMVTWLLARIPKGSQAQIRAPEHL